MAPPEERFPELKFLEPKDAAELIKEGSVAVIDVRDEDFESGHVPGAINVPSANFGDKVNGIVEQKKDASKLLFYCGHSVNRGPTCAQKFLEASAGHKGNIFVVKGGYAQWAEDFADNGAMIEK